MGRGKVTYVPKVVIDELEDIGREKKCKSQKDSFNEMTNYSKVGREAERILKLDWGKKRRK